MSSSIIKNAVIVVGVEQGKVNFKLPGLEKLIKQNEKIEKQIGSQTKKLDVLSKAQIDAGKKAAEVTKQRDAALKRLDAVQRRASEAGVQGARRQAEATLQAEQAQARLLAQTRATQRGIIEGTQQIGEGVFTLARGFTLLGFEGDASLKKIISDLARVQGAFDIFRGISNTIKGVITVTELLSAVEVKNTTSIVANTSATQVNTQAKLANKAASVGLAAAIGPVGIAAAAATAAISAALAIRRRLEEQNRRLIVSEKGLADQLSITHAGFQRRLEQSRDRRSLIGLKKGDEALAEQLAAAKFDRGTLFVRRENLARTETPETPAGRKALAEQQLIVARSINRENEDILRLSSQIFDQTTRRNTDRLSEAKQLQSTIDLGQLSGPKLEEARQRFQELTGGKSIDQFGEAVEAENAQRVQKFDDFTDRMIDIMEKQGSRILDLENQLQEIDTLQQMRAN